MAEPQSVDAPGPSYRRVLREPSFFRLWLSQLISQSGDFVFAVALIWLVLQVTGSVVDVTAVFAATIVPGVVLGPFLGVYVDRWDRRRALVVTNVVEGLLVAGLALVIVGRVADLGVVLAIVLALGAGGSIVRATTNALIPQVVAPADLTPANALQFFSGSFNQVIGFTIGGVAVALVGPVLPIEYDAVTFFLAAVLVAGVSRRFARPPDAGEASRRFFSEMREGFRFLRSERALLELLVLGMIVNFFGNAVFALFAPYAEFILTTGAAGYGVLTAAVAGGSIVGAIAMGQVDTRRSAGRFLFGGGTAIGLAVIGLGLAHEFALAVGVALVTGGILAVTNLPISVLFQAKVPGRLLGRVGAASGAFIQAAAPAGALLAGPMAQRLSIPSFYIAAGLAIFAVMVAGWVVLRQLREVTYGEPGPAPAGSTGG